MKEFDWRRIGKQALGAILVTFLTLGLILAKTWRQPSRQVLASLQLGPSRIGHLPVDPILRRGCPPGDDDGPGWRGADLLSVGLRTVLAGYFIAAVTPLRCGRGPVQAYSLYRGGIPSARLAASSSSAAFLPSGS